MNQPTEAAAVATAVAVGDIAEAAAPHVQAAAVATVSGLRVVERGFHKGAPFVSFRNYF